MKRKLFSFRWDIDHRACMTDGIPNIRSVCRDLSTPNTFFVNMGRSTNLKEWLGKGLRGSRQKLADTEAINLVEKIGVRRFVIETFLSRPVGLSFIGPLQELLSEGHELGLHGGSDHVVWSRRFGELTAEFLEQDVSATLDEFRTHFGDPAGFTSPGFRSDARIMDIVQRLGFRYHGDQIGGFPQQTELDGRRYDHWTVPVTICGPRTIPFLEWHAARGTPRTEVLSAFEKIIEGQTVAVLYGHPCHEGLDRDLLHAVFRIVERNGFDIVTHAELVERLQAGFQLESVA